MVVNGSPDPIQHEEEEEEEAEQGSTDPAFYEFGDEYDDEYNDEYDDEYNDEYDDEYDDEWWLIWMDPGIQHQCTQHAIRGDSRELLLFLFEAVAEIMEIMMILIWLWIPRSSIYAWIRGDSRELAAGALDFSGAAALASFEAIAEDDMDMMYMKMNMHPRR